jgi:hypothetical protein
MLAPPASLRQTAIHWNCSACKTKFSTSLEIFRSLHRFTICTWLSNFHTYMSILCITKSCRQQAEVIQNHENANVHNIRQGEPWHRKYKRLKLGNGQAYDRSSNYTAVVAGATNDRAWSAVLSLDWQRPCVRCIYIHLITCKLYILTWDLLLLTVTLANDRPVLSSERVPHISKPATVWQ